MDFRRWMLGPVLLWAAAVVCAQNPAPQKTSALDRQFQSAVSQYHAGDLAGAASRLEALLPQAGGSYPVHELLGLVYAAQAQAQQSQAQPAKIAQSIEQLQIAVRLQPNSAAARTNLAASLMHAGKSDQAEEQLRKALTLEPDDYQANHNLADIYLQSGRIAAAIPLLEAAQRAHPDSYENGYNLALAYDLIGRLADARSMAQRLAQQKDSGELHSLLGKIAEKDGDYLEAAKQFQSAAQMDPSEDNLFAWGSELLLHRTYDPAILVFQEAAQRYPQSSRLWAGLGMALYARTRYEESVQALLTAADRNPADPRCYLFLSKAYLSSPNQADAVIARFRRYAELEPKNALAQYYYAVSLWKGKRSEASSIDYPLVASLLVKSIALDGRLAEAHLQLGILYADQHEYAKALPEYTRAIALDPDLPDAHYRLGQYYVHAGDKQRAQQEFQSFQQLQAHHQAEVDKERAEVKEFVTASQAPAATP